MDGTMAGLYIANKIKKQIKSEQEIQGTKAELLSLDPFVFTDTLELLSNYLQEIQKSIYNIQNNNVPDPILLSSPHSLPIWMTYLPKSSTRNEREGKQKITQPQGVKKMSWGEGRRNRGANSALGVEEKEIGGKKCEKTTYFNIFALQRQAKQNRDTFLRRTEAINTIPALGRKGKDR